MLSNPVRNEKESVSYQHHQEGQLLAPLTFEGSCNKDLFENWLRNCLLPQLEPGDIIIIDNASFHRGESIKEIVEGAGCEIWYLPPYSPDLNKIEQRKSNRTFNWRGHRSRAS